MTAVAWEGGNYLRVRGEYAARPHKQHLPRELPPRTRRIQTLLTRDNNKHGTTSAYAENTTTPHAALSASWNYLRVRGEYDGGSVTNSGAAELPPRTRRIPNSDGTMRYSNGTTSAYAENTGHDFIPRGFQGNYLRVRGEYLSLGL